jgi:hypothetical protein
VRLLALRIHALSPNLLRCGRADFYPDAPIGTASDSACFCFSSRLKRSSPSRSLAFAGSGGQHRTRHGGFLSNNVEAGHVAQRSVRRLLIACLPKLKCSSVRRSPAFWGAPVCTKHGMRLLFFRSIPRSWPCSRSRRLLRSDRLHCTAGALPALFAGSA